MRRISWWNLSLIAALATACATGIDKAGAASALDGDWNVAIVTESGDCGPASLGVVIRDGSLQYAGDSSVTIHGRVAKSGIVDVSVAGGNRTASGKGRLSSKAGAGTWRGAGSTGSCTGRWSAERH
jgi:hypothetical protein